LSLAVSIEADSDRVDQLLSELEGKSIEEVIASGVSKLANVPSGGGGGGGAAAGGGGGAAAAGVYCVLLLLMSASGTCWCRFAFKRNMHPSTCADAAKGQLSHQPVVIVNVIILPVRGKSHQTVALYDVLLSVLQAALLRRRQRRRRRSLKRSLTRYNPISSSLSLNEAFTIMRLHIDCAWDSKQSCLLCGMHIVARSKHAWFPVAPDFGWHLSNLVMICSFCYLQDMGFSLFD